MKCEKCKGREATTHVKRVVNGRYEEYMLCADCAHEMGFDNVFSFEMPDMFSGLVQSLFGALPARSGASRCPECGSTFGDIQNTGKVGCAECYRVFRSELMPSIKRIHGNTAHCGKIPYTVEPDGKKDNQKKRNQTELERMNSELKAAVEAQNFERAAELRDKIREMESEQNG